ncbi:MAG: ABC transporter permease subunit, partial [Pseudomonadota bacterium]
RFDFDLGRAAQLGLVQVGLCAALAFLSFQIAIPQARLAGLDGVAERWDVGVMPKVLDFTIIALAVLFLLTPLVMLLWRGAPFLFDLPISIWRAVVVSLSVALVSTAIVLGAALSLALAGQRMARGEAWGSALSALILATSPLVMGSGLFIMLFPFVNPLTLALPVTIAVNVVLALPFALRVIQPALRAVEEAYGPVADSLGMAGWARLRWLLLPRLRRPLGFAAGLSAALSMGDLGVIALFANPDYQTLPLAMYQLMAAYRLEQAAGAALLLLALSFALFWLFDRGGRADADI